MPETHSKHAIPLVTIGIPTYNRVTGFFPQALASALEQDYPNLEIVVCDNASTDGTQAYMESLADPRVRYVRHAVNIGANPNYNACLDSARGEYFVLLHDDDLIAPNFVSACVEALAGGLDVGLVRTGANVIDAAGRVTSTHTLNTKDLDVAGVMRRWFERSTSFYLASTLFNTKHLRAVGGLESPHNLYQDVKAMVQVMARYGRIDVPEPLASYRWHAENRGSFNTVMAWAEDSLHLLEVVAAELPAAADELRPLGRHYLCNVSYRRAAAVSKDFAGRWRAYRQIEQMFDRAASPYAFELRRLRRLLRTSVGTLVRGLTARRPKVGSGDAVA